MDGAGPGLPRQLRGGGRSRPSIKLARFATKRPYVVAFLGAFHGRTYGAVSLTASKAKYHAGFGPLLPGVFHAPYGRVEDLRWFDDVLFDKLAPANEVAAIIVEPIQGEGGYIVPEDGFLQGLRAICDAHGILLIADEIQSGAGRTGKMWAIEHWGVKPDILLTAKGIASGMPLARDGRAQRTSWRRGDPARTARRTVATRSPAPPPWRRSTCSRAVSSTTPRARGDQAHGGPARHCADRYDGLVARRPRQGPDDRHRVRHARARRGGPVGRASSAGCWCSSAASRASGMSPALTVTEAEMATALRLFADAVAEVAGDDRSVLRSRNGSPAPIARGRSRRMTSKVASMRDAVAALVRDGDTVAIEGFTHLIGFAAGHEIIRQRRRDLTLARLTPDVIYDQMIAGGVASKLIFSWLGNPGVGGLGAIRRRIEGDAPATSRWRSRSTATSAWSAGTRPGP